MRKCHFTGLDECKVSPAKSALILLMFLMVFSAFPGARGQTLQPGTLVGDMAAYKTRVVWQGDPSLFPTLTGFAQLNSTTQLTIRVAKVASPNVTLALTQNYENGTASIGTLVVNVQTGVVSHTGIVPGGLATVLVTAGALHAPDPVWDNGTSLTLDNTAGETIFAIPRTLNMLNQTSTGLYSTTTIGVAWDQASGLLVDASISETLSPASAAATFLISLAGTDVWTNFQVSATPNPLMLTGSSLAVSKVHLTGLRGFTGPLELSVAGPTGVTASIAPNTVTIPTNDQSVDTTLTVSAGPSFPLGTYSLTVNASSPRGSQSTTLTLMSAADTRLSCGSAGNCFILSDANVTSTTYTQGNIQFTANGPSGDEAFANVTIPRTAVSGIDGIHVMLNGVAQPGSAVTTTDNGIDYFVYFSFTFHSPVNVSIQLDQVKRPGNFLGIPGEILYGGLAATVVFALVGVGVFSLRRKKRTSENFRNQSTRASTRRWTVF